MNLRSKQIEENEKSLNFNKRRNIIMTEQTCDIPIQHLKLPKFRSVIYIADHDLILATDQWGDNFAGKVVNNRIEFCSDANKILSEFKYVIVDFKKHQLIAFQGGKIIKLQLDNFHIVEEVSLRGFSMNNFYFRITQEENNLNNFIIFGTFIKMELRKIANLKVQFQLIQTHSPTNFKLNKYWFTYEERAHFFIRYNLNGKLIRKLQSSYRGQKHLDSILVIPHRYINQEYCTEIVNPNSMKPITQLNAKSGQYVDSILIEEQNKLIILNKKNIMAYDARNYQLLDEIKIPNYGIPKKLNYHSKTGIQIYYENKNIEFPIQQN